MKNRLLAIIALLFVMARCTSDKKNEDLIINCSDSGTIEINLNEAVETNVCDFEEFVDRIKIIQLETNNNSLLHEPIYKTLYTKDRIYFWDGYQMDGVICFDKNGKFIKRLIKGQGPGEIIQVADVVYDSDKEQIIVVSNPQLIFYDKNLNYIKSKRLPYGVNGFRKINNDYMFIRGLGYNRDGNYIDDYLFELTDTNFVSKHFMIKSLTNYPILSRVNEVDEKLIFAIPGSDTIYSYTNGVLNKEYVLKYKNKTALSLDNYMQSFKIPGIIFLCNFNETHNYQVFSLEEDGYKYIIYRDKKSGKIKGSKFFRWKNDELIDGIQRVATTYGDTMVSVCWPIMYPKGSLKSDKYISKEDQQKLEKLEAEDNPYLILYTLKDFDDE